MSTNERYNQPWYEKRICQNRNIKDHLIKIIRKHREEDFPWIEEKLVYLNYEDIFEVAVAAVNKDISITLGMGQDISNGYDCKFSIVRMNGGIKQPQYTAGITGCKNKKAILACVYEGIQEKFYYFAFPVSFGEHSIPFNRQTGNPLRTNYMWQKYECKTFEEMALNDKFISPPLIASSPTPDSDPLSKNHPNLQNTNLCIEVNDPQQSLSFEEIQPTCPSD